MINRRRELINESYNIQELIHKERTKQNIKRIKQEEIERLKNSR